MIVLSLVLVIVAAVTLVLGVFQDGLTLIYVSIGTCLAAMVLLGVGVLMRRREDTQAAPSPAGYGPGAAADQGAAGHRDEEVRVREADEGAQARPAKKAVVKKVSATPTVPGRESTTEQPAVGGPATGATGAAAAASAATGDEDAPQREEGAPAPAVAPRKVAAKKATVKKATTKKATAKKATASAAQAPAVAADAPAAASTAKKATAKKATAKKATAKKATAKKATAKKATAKKAAAKKATAKKATAKKATGSSGASLPDIKGLGPAKKKALLAQFGSVESIRSADVSELAAVRGVGPGLAEELKRELGG